MIFFDLDGTLLDDGAAVNAGVREFHVRYGARLGLSYSELAIRWDTLLARYFPQYLAGQLSMREQRRARMRELFASTDIVSEVDLDEAFAVYLGSYERAWQPFGDVVSILSRLMRYQQLGIITNGDEAQQRKKLEHTGLIQFFTVVVTSGDVGIAKPAPAIFLEACRRAHSAVGDTVYVGDDWTLDVDGSRTAGLQPVWLRRSQCNHRIVPPSVRVIDSLVELPAILAS